jgi:hypothetical protein
MSVKPDEKFSDEEAQRRFEAAIRGARVVGHESMKDISPKRQSEMNVGKRKAKKDSECNR